MVKKDINMTIQTKLDEFFNSSHAVQIDDGSWYYHYKPVETELSELYQRIAELEQAIMSNCYDAPSTQGKSLMALTTKGGAE